MLGLERHGAVPVRFILTAVILATLAPVVLASGYSLLRFAEDQRRSYEQQALRIASRTAAAVDRDLELLDIALETLGATGRPPNPLEVRALELRTGGVLVHRPGICRDAAYASNLRLEPEPHVVICGPGGPDLAARMPVASLGRNLTAAGADERWTLSIVDNADRIIWRSRDAPAHVGDLATADLRRNARGAAGFWRGTTLEGTQVVAAYARSRRTGFRVAVGAPVGIVEAPLRRSIAIFSATGVLALLASLVAGWLVAGLLMRPLRALAEAGSRLDSGTDSQGPRTPIAEIAAVSTAFEEAASRLRATASEREHALAELAESRQRYLNLLDNVPVAIVETDDRGVWVYANPAAERLLKLSRSSVVGRTYDAPDWGIRTAEGAPIPTEDLPTARSLRGEVVVGYEHVIQHPGTGRRIFLSVNSAPLTDPTGRVTGSIAAFADITERNVAQRALARAEKRLRATNEHAGVGIAELSRDGVFLSANGAMRSLTGYSEPELAGLALGDLVRSEGVEVQAFLAEARRTGTGASRTAQFELTTLEGRTVCADIMASWVGEGDSDSEGFFVAVIQDVTEEKRALERQKLLVNELNHRVKNMLTTVMSLSVQTARSSSGLPDFRQRFESRIHALAITHDLLTSERWEGAGLIDILKAELRPYADADRPDSRIGMSGPAVRLSPGAAVSLSLVVHELVTNAVKYGALKLSNTGRLGIAWRQAGDWIELDWVEQQDTVIEPPAQLGFGSRLIDQVMRADLSGTIERRYEPSGLVARLRFRSDNGR